MVTVFFVVCLFSQRERESPFIQSAARAVRIALCRFWANRPTAPSALSKSLPSSRKSRLVRSTCNWAFIRL